MPYPKRLIEVDLPIKRISAHARREKSIRHGHISTLPQMGMTEEDGGEEVEQILPQLASTKRSLSLSPKDE